MTLDLKEVDILGPSIGSHWYYRAKANVVTAWLAGMRPSVLLDVGAGSAFFSRHLLANTGAKEAWCVDISYTQDSDTFEGGKPVFHRRSIGNINADLVLLMDVLEHVDDDVGLLKQYAEKVSPGSRFLITVPAFEFLWSGHDDFLEHKRRYSLQQLERVVRDSGLRVRQASYCFGIVFPLVAPIRLLQRLRGRSSPAKSQLKRHSLITNSLLRWCCSVELPFTRFNRVAGLTVLCLAEKAP